MWGKHTWSSPFYSFLPMRTWGDRWACCYSKEHGGQTPHSHRGSYHNFQEQEASIIFWLIFVVRSGVFATCKGNGWEGSNGSFPVKNWSSWINSSQTCTILDGTWEFQSNPIPHNSDLSEDTILISLCDFMLHWGTCHVSRVYSHVSSCPSSISSE